MKKWYYERNKPLLESEVNVTYEQLLWMTETEFREWCVRLRKEVVRIWDEEGIPPRVGYDEEEIVEQFNKIEPFPVHEFEAVDENTGKRDCVRNTSIIGNAANQFFPTMLKTKINYKDSGDGISIYDCVARDDFFEMHYKALKRNLKKDGFYHYSAVVEKNKLEYQYATKTALEWIETFEEHRKFNTTTDYWISEKDIDVKYTGNSTKVRGMSFLELSAQELRDNLEKIHPNCLSNIDTKDIKDDCKYQLRFFKLGQKVFPLGLKTFRVALVQYAVNFPPLTAKYLYQRFTSHIKKEGIINIWDPSSGWGGRLLGAMGLKEREGITYHYIGTDPNTDHNTDNFRTKYHELADFYNSRTNRGASCLPGLETKNTYEIYQCGSEEMREQEGFYWYKGKLDLVFTSPPYFNREQYSQDESQSYKKFSNYDSWKEGFLRPTLETAVEWLRPDRYLLWNIADINLGDHYLPLEKDSRDILESLGMEYKGFLKMTMNPMPGAGRKTFSEDETEEDKEGKSTFKNTCKVNGKTLKFEPIFLFYKSK